MMILMILIFVYDIVILLYNLFTTLSGFVVKIQGKNKYSTKYAFCLLNEVTVIYFW